MQASRDDSMKDLSTEACLTRNSFVCRTWVERYAADKDLFFSQYAAAHCQMSEMGAKFDPPDGIDIGEGDEQEEDCGMQDDGEDVEEQYAEPLALS